VVFNDKAKIIFNKIVTQGADIEESIQQQQHKNKQRYFFNIR
jgi:hypothetical protein